MQYILSSEEYENLVSAKAAITQIGRSQLQKLCTKIANTMPVDTGNYDEPWGCNINYPSNLCCDKCPVLPICPHDNKYFSE